MSSGCDDKPTGSSTTGLIHHIVHGCLHVFVLSDPLGLKQKYFVDALLTHTHTHILSVHVGCSTDQWCQKASERKKAAASAA